MAPSTPTANVWWNHSGMTYLVEQADGATVEVADGDSVTLADGVDFTGRYGWEPDAGTPPRKGKPETPDPTAGQDEAPPADPPAPPEAPPTDQATA